LGFSALTANVGKIGRFLLARMLGIMDSMTICKAEVSLQMNCLLRLDEFNPVLRNSSYVSSACGDIIFITK